MPSSKGSSVSDCGLNYVPPENTDVLSVVPVNVTLVGNTVFFWWGRRGIQPWQTGSSDDELIRVGPHPI